MGETAAHANARGHVPRKLSANPTQDAPGRDQMGRLATQRLHGLPLDEVKFVDLDAAPPVSLRRAFPPPTNGRARAPSLGLGCGRFQQWHVTGPYLQLHVAVGRFGVVAHETAVVDGVGEQRQKLVHEFVARVVLWHDELHVLQSGDDEGRPLRRLPR